MVSHNISLDADNFKVTRRLTVINTRTDTVLFEMEGVFSVDTDHTNNELDVIVKTGPDNYQKHFFALTAETFYVVEDIDTNDVDPFHYSVTFLPQSLLPHAPNVEWTE